MWRVVGALDNARSPDELIEGESSCTIRRRLNDGTAFRAVKVPYELADLEQRMANPRHADIGALLLGSRHCCSRRVS